MRRKMWMKRCALTWCLALSLAMSSVSVCYGEKESSQEGEQTKEQSGNQEENRIEITDEKSFLEFAEKCKYDSASLGLTVSLMADLDLAGEDFDGIPYFCGLFEGNGHQITNIRIHPKGSNYGLFRYVGETGQIKDLYVEGEVTPSGSQENIGGIAGVNYGTIENCSFKGMVSGINAVGAVTGFNKGTGKILSCSSDAVVLATNFTGGITGKNEGYISECVSKSSINTEELEPTLDLGGVDLSSFNFAQNVVNRNDMGGIAGTSNGLIQDCKNEGSIGYKHTGYNVGGIAGSQSGIILTSTNEGKVYGRKDVGGIVGQAEPYVESEYLEDKVQQTKDDINRLSNTVNNISATMSSTSAELKQYAENLNAQYQASLDQLSGNLGTLTDAAQGNTEAQGYVDNINAAMDNIHSIQSSGGELTEEQTEAIQNNLGIINDNLGSLQGTYSGDAASQEDFSNQISNQLQQKDRSQEIQDFNAMATTIDNGMQSITSNMKSAVNQMNHIADSLSDDINAVTGDEEIIEDISSLETAENTDGVVSGCINRGEVNGDLNVGGIAGTMNIEYDGDPEFDLNLRESTNVRLRSTVNGVMIHCQNYGSVLAKKNCTGGIVGLQELGFIYDCESYGLVSADAGNYLGGIAGNSAGAIEKSYSLCTISGTDYVGGICGNGYTVKDSISVSDIDSSGERLGSIAGYLEEEGTVRGNLFVSEDMHGIDNISYAGAADRVSYEEIMDREDIPAGFHCVTITFETEEGVLAKKEIPYGGNLTEKDFPKVPEKDGCYVEWPEEKDLKDIRKNLSVTAEYASWVESVASEEQTEDGKPILLAVGEFYGNTKLEMKETEGPQGLDTEAVLAYAYTWTLKSDREKEFETIEAHLAIPSGAERTVVWIQTDGNWKEVESTVDGSYLVAEIPFGTAFAVTTMPEAKNPYLYVGAAAGIVLIILLVLWRTRKKRAAKKKKAADKE